MRILHIISGIDAKHGGPTAALYGLSVAQAAIGHDVTVLSTFVEPAALASADRFQKRGVNVVMVGPATGAPCRHPDVASTADRLVADADVVHVHALWEEVQHQAARAAQRHRKPYLIRPCGMLSPWSLAQGRLKKRLYMLARLRRNLNGASAIHYTTGDERDFAARLRLRPPSIVEPNGIDLAEFRDLPPKGFLRARHPEIGTRKVILFLGRIHPGKGLETLVPALAKMRTPAENVVLVAVGPDSDGYKAVIEQSIREHGVAGRVVFTGLLAGRDRVAALADADLFSLPSAHENFGISIVEALAAGTPVVISDQCGIHAEVSQAQVGGVVPLDAQRLAAELDRWLNDAAVRAAAAERARPFVWRYYDWEQIARRWTGHFDAIRAAR